MEYYSRLTVRKLRFWRGEEICPGSHSSQMAVHGFEADPLNPSLLLSLVSQGVSKLSFLRQTGEGNAQWEGSPG